MMEQKTKNDCEVTVRDSEEVVEVIDDSGEIEGIKTIPLYTEISFKVPQLKKEKSDSDDFTSSGSPYSSNEDSSSEQSDVSRKARLNTRSTRSSLSSLTNSIRSDLNTDAVANPNESDSSDNGGTPGDYDVLLPSPRNYELPSTSSTVVNAAGSSNSTTSDSLSVPSSSGAVKESSVNEKYSKTQCYGCSSLVNCIKVPLCAKCTVHIRGYDILSSDTSGSCSVSTSYPDSTDTSGKHSSSHDSSDS